MSRSCQPRRCSSRPVITPSSSINRITLALLAGALLLAGCGGEEPGEAPDRDPEPPRAESDPAPGAGDEPASKERDRQRPPKRADTPGIPDDAKRAAVVRVVDGDTVELSGLGNARLIGVDTPEVHGGVECYGREASDFAKSHLVPGDTVHFVRGVEGTDRYGRPLVYLWLAGGSFFNAALVERGYAMPLTIPPNVDYVDLFRRLAREARREDRGLWSPSTCGGGPEGQSGAGASGSGGGGAPGGGSSGGCEPGYSPCVPPYPPDVDCADVDGPITVTGRDPHGLDGDGDGVGCE